jgi:predicted enzyme related to lactoylglutathione lyase
MAKAKKTKMKAKTKVKAKAKPAAKAKKKAPARRAASPKRANHPAVVHWEVQAKDPVRQQEFFSSLFGWKIDANNPMSYGMVSGAGKDTIGGGIGGTQDSPRVTVYVHVSDITQTLERAESLGAPTVMPRTDIGPVIMGLFRDPEGNVIGLIE